MYQKYVELNLYNDIDVALNINRGLKRLENGSFLFLPKLFIHCSLTFLIIRVMLKLVLKYDFVLLLDLAYEYVRALNFTESENMKICIRCICVIFYIF